jgi:hypothetical protein
MAFSDAGATTKDLYFVPHVSASGNCPSTEGTTPCTFQRRPGLLPIIIRSSASDLQLPPEGVRMSEDYDSAGFLATLTVPVGNVNNNGSLAWFITGGQADGQDETMAGQIRIGPGIKIVNENDGSNRPYCNQFVTSTWNTDWIFDRDIFSSTGTPQRWGGSSCPNFTANGFNAAWINSLFLNMTNWDGGGSTTEGASGTITRGPGPVVFYNNRIEGAGVTIHFDDQGGTQFVRGDYSFIRNTLLAKEEWQLGSATSDGHHYYMRQPLEFKAGWRNLVCGNIFDRTWNEVTPTSLFLTLTSVNGEGITDTNICNNIFKHGPGGINIQLVGGNDPITIPPNRQMVYNNLFYDINGTYVATGGPAGRGWMFQGPGGGEDIIVDHNTFVGPTGSAPDIFRLQNYPVEGTLVASNFFYFDQSTQGMQMEGGLGTGTCTGLQAKALADCFFTPNYVFSKNVMGSVDSTQAQVITSWGSTPNFAPSSPASLTDINWLGLSDNNYRLSNTSSYRSGGASKGLDAQDVGANITMLERATGKVSGARVPENTITSTSAVIAFNAPDHQGCPVDVSTSAIPSSGVTPARFNDLGTVAGPRTVSATGLTAATLYHYRIQCAVEQPQGVFRTSNASVTVLLQTLSGCSTAGSGGNDTTCIQNAFTSTAGSLQILEMPAPSSGFYNVDPLTCVDHMNVLMDAGAHIKANTGISDGVAIINCDNHSNITFNGSPGSSSIEGRKSEYTSGESRHCIRFAGSTDVLFQGIACNNSGGDGIYIGEGTRGYALRIEVANALFDNNSRNGITIISCDTCNIHDTTSSNTKGENGAAPDGPYAGIDIEPNEAVGHVYSLDRLVNIQLINLTLSGNGVSTDHAASNGNGFTCHLDLLTAADSPANTSISGANITSINNVNSGFHITNEHDVVGNSGPGKPGGVALTSSHATGNGMYGTRAYFYDAGGPVFSYTSSVNTNNNMLGTTIDNTDMSVERGGGAVNDMGAIQWTGDSVISTNGNLQYYFDVEDFSSVGLSNITIDTFGTLSGATGGSNGLVNGSPATTVNIP